MSDVHSTGALRQQPEAVDREQWQPIETAPRDGTSVLVWPPTWTGTASAAKWESDEYAKRPRPYWRRSDALGSVTISRDKPPTHWMPPPKPPKTASGSHQEARSNEQGEST